MSTADEEMCLQDYRIPSWGTPKSCRIPDAAAGITAGVGTSDLHKVLLRLVSTSLLLIVSDSPDDAVRRLVARQQCSHCQRILGAV